MLRVTIELVPYGDETRAREIYTCDIVNDGFGDKDTGYYYAEDKTNRVDIGAHERQRGAILLAARALAMLARRGGAR